MSSWASAQLAFGFDLGEGIPSEFVFYHGEDEEPMHEDDVANAFAEWGAKQFGVDHPGHFNNMERDPQWKKYREVIDEFYKICPVSILTYGDYRSTSYFLALESTIQSGDQYSPTAVSTYKVDTKILKEFCEKYNFPYKEPSWQLVCNYS